MMNQFIGQEYVDFFTGHRQEFQDELLNEAANVRGKIEEILFIGNIDLLNNAHKLVMYTLDGNVEQLEKFAQVEGVSWASHNLTLALKLEWVQAIRRTIWRFMQQFDQETNGAYIANFYELEKQVNDQIDKFLNGFFLNYSDYKDQLIESQRSLVENLSVPIIPITANTCVLPLIGQIDFNRLNTLEEKVLEEISKQGIGTLVIDLSGIAQMESNGMEHMMRIIEGANMMGCECVITGLRPDIVRNVTKLGISFENKATTKATLQQALEDYLVTK